MLNIFQYYAQYALKTEEGTKAPPKPKKPLQDLFSQSTFGRLFIDARDHFLQEHRDIFPELNDVESLEDEFEKMFNVGIFKFGADLDEGFQLVVRIHLMLWNGFEYVSINDVMHELFDFEEKQQDL